MERKKLNKQKREQLKAVKANEFNKAFSMGYEVGYMQGVKDGEAKKRNIQISRK